MLHGAVCERKCGRRVSGRRVCMCMVFANAACVPPQPVLCVDGRRAVDMCWCRVWRGETIGVYKSSAQSTVMQGTSPHRPKESPVYVCDRLIATGADRGVCNDVVRRVSCPCVCVCVCGTLT